MSSMSSTTTTNVCKGFPEITRPDPAPASPSGRKGARGREGKNVLYLGELRHTAGCTHGNTPNKYRWMYGTSAHVPVQNLKQPDIDGILG
jgi:hypothetical protein